jgi:hypothetical protein
MSRDDETHRPIFGWSSRGNFFIFIPFCNMNSLISLHSIFQDEESLGQEEKVEAAVLETFDRGQVAGLETSDGGQDSEEEEDDDWEGHEDGVGLDDEVVGVMGLL